MKKIWVIFAVLLMPVVFLSGCLSAEESKFIGSWKDPMSGVVEFKQDLIFFKKAEITGWGITVEGSWRVENNVLYIEYTLDGEKQQ